MLSSFFPLPPSDLAAAAAVDVPSASIVCSCVSSQVLLRQSDEALRPRRGLARHARGLGATNSSERSATQSECCLIPTLLHSFRKLEIRSAIDSRPQVPGVLSRSRSLSMQVRSKFAAIRNTDVAAPAFEKDPWRKQDLGKLFRCVPVKDLRSLKISWPVPCTTSCPLERLSSRCLSLRPSLRRSIPPSLPPSLYPSLLASLLLALSFIIHHTCASSLPLCHMNSSPSIHRV